MNVYMSFIVLILAILTLICFYAYVIYISKRNEDTFTDLSNRDVSDNESLSNESENETVSEDSENMQITTHFVCDESLSDKNIECSICLDTFQKGEYIGLLVCSHMFHFKCLNEWLNLDGEKRCPLCLHSYFEINSLDDFELEI